MNITQLLQRLRYLIETERVQRRWSDSELLLYLNDAQEYMRALKIEADPDYYLDAEMSEDIGLEIVSEGTGLWSLTLPWYMEFIRRIEKFGTSGTDLGTAVEQTKLRDHYRGKTWSYFQGVYGTQNWMYGGPRKVFFTTNEPGGNFRIWFVRQVPRMVRFPAIAAAPDTFRFLVDVSAASILGEIDVRENYYKGANVQVVAAGGAAPEGEIQPVTAFTSTGLAYPQRRFLTEDFSDVINDDDTMEILPTIEVMHQELLVYLAAERALAKAGNRDQIDALGPTKGELLAQYLTTATDRYDSTPDHVSWAGDDMR